MPRKLTYTDDALADLDDARRWLTQAGSGLSARRRLAAIWRDVERLREYPCRWPESEHPGIRERPCAGGYRALYQVDPDTGLSDTAGDVLVLRVYGPGQDRRGDSPLSQGQSP